MKSANVPEIKEPALYQNGFLCSKTLFLLASQGSIDRLGSLFVGRNVARRNLDTVDKDTWGSGYTIIHTCLEVGFDLIFVSVLVETSLEGYHVQVQGFGESNQAFIIERALVFTVPVLVECIMVIPESTLMDWSELPELLKER